MKRNNILRFSIFLILLFFLADGFHFVCAQVNVTHVDMKQKLSDKFGIYYYLPRTVVKVEVTVNKTENIRGPYYQFAEKYIGIKNFITNNSTHYEISDIKVSTYSQPDPEQLYFVQTDSKSSKDVKPILISLSESGLIQAVNDISKNQKTNKLHLISRKKQNILTEPFKFYAGNNMMQKVDTIIRRVDVDTNTIEKQFYKKRWVEKSSEEKAKESSEFISKIKENRFKLLTGFQEVSYQKGSIEYMDKQLKELQNEYLSLFTGRSLHETLKYCFTYLPESNKGNINVPIFRFSEDKGIFDLSHSTGKKINIRIEKINNTDILTDYIKKKDYKKKTHGFYYRIPEYAKITIKYGDTKNIDTNLIISQFGVVNSLPSNKSEIRYYPKTGAIKNVVLE